MGVGDRINRNRFPNFLPTAFLTTASPTLTLTLDPNPDPSPDHDCSHLLVRDPVVRNAVGRKGGHHRNQIILLTSRL